MSLLTEMHLPGPKEIKDLLDGLLDKDVTLAPASPLAPSQVNPVSVAVYVDDSLRVRALIVCDLALSTYAGAALGLVPPKVASDEVEASGLSESLRANLYEVLNIAASLFNVPDAPHVRLHDMHAVGEPTPPPVLAQCLTLGRREDLAVTIGGYGSGQLSVVLTHA
jgi:hypothetical protein